jgi:hypothetical protein
MKQQPPLEAIKRNCLECAGETSKEVILCPKKDCPLYPYRFGVRPDSQVYKDKIDLALEKWPEEARDSALE